MNEYRRLPLRVKKIKENVLNSVKKVLSREKLTTNQVRKVARKARAYTCAYYTVDTRLLSDSQEILGLSGNTTLPDIERLQKTFRTHRAA